MTKRAERFWNKYVAKIEAVVEDYKQNPTKGDDARLSRGRIAKLRDEAKDLVLAMYNYGMISDNEFDDLFQPILFKALDAKDMIYDIEDSLF